MRAESSNTFLCILIITTFSPFGSGHKRVENRLLWHHKKTTTRGGKKILLCIRLSDGFLFLGVRYSTTISVILWRNGNMNINNDEPLQRHLYYPMQWDFRTNIICTISFDGVITKCISKINIRLQTKVTQVHLWVTVNITNPAIDVDEDFQSQAIFQIYWDPPKCIVDNSLPF
jgi:hypothetical protein